MMLRSNRKREAFLHRISTVGGGVREDVQMMLGSIVCDLRDMVERGVFQEEEMDTVILFHDQTEAFWRRTMATSPPIDPQLMVAGLRRLRTLCSDPLAGFAPRLDHAVEQARTFAARKQV
jgi:hypothetical protein